MARHLQGNLVAIGSNLYGVAMNGGTGGARGGTVFSIPETGGAPTLVGSFNGLDGWQANGSLIAVGNTLYGTAQFAGPGGEGDRLFGAHHRRHTHGAGELRWRHHDEGNPFGGLVAVGNKLYGTTDAGGCNGYGTIFSLLVDGGLGDHPGQLPTMRTDHLPPPV